jgi:hypothetical protein
MPYNGFWMMLEWSDDTYEGLASRSQLLFKNKHVLPVAVWVAQAPSNPIQAGDIVRGTEGRIASNKALEALAHLRDSGLLIELPFLGRPHPRLFQKRRSLFWGAVSEMAEEGIEGASAMRPRSA